MSAKRRIALVGNPNSGKTSLFNYLTGLNQHVGNFPGVTVEKKIGTTSLPDGTKVDIIDLPGTYSIYPNSVDEKIVYDVLTHPNSENYPDLAVVIVDASNLKRNLLLFSQIYDLGVPVILALNMMDMVRKSGVQIDVQKLHQVFGVLIIPIEARTGKGIPALKDQLAKHSSSNGAVHPAVFEAKNFAGEAIEMVKSGMGNRSDYAAYQLLQQYRINDSLSDSEKALLSGIEASTGFNNHELRKTETIYRYRAITQILEAILSEKKLFSDTLSDKLDKVLTHRIWGYVIFLSILFLIFQAIFAWATVPMDFIDMVFSQLGSGLANWLPAGVLTDLLTEGIIPGIGGIVIFIPQIAILFAFIGILEETGYMARVVFLMDKIMRKFGLNGRSVVPLISGVACAIPAIMATRTIDSWKERLITIFVTPLMSCSARLPVYTILIALIIPDNPFYQGLALMTMYLLGVLAAVSSAWVMKLILKTRDRSFLIMELPTYKLPRATNVLLVMYEKSKAFVFEAGKIILAISIILWVLASYGPGNEMGNAAASVTEEHPELTGEAFEQAVESYKLEHSYAGHFGKFIEPVIKPLGYDWKIGIALITSFAAREVFVGTMATIYSIGNTDDEATIKTRMKREINAETGAPRYDLATGWSLLIFYAFAMQCMSTLAIVQKETRSWRWPMLQLVFMSGLAYLSSFVIYQVLS